MHQHISAWVLRLLVAIGLIVLAASVGAKDVWDLSYTGDNTYLTDNELVHGSDQIHDLEEVSNVHDQDWFVVALMPYSSYEVIVDGLTEEISVVPPIYPGEALEVDLVDFQGNVLVSGGPTTTALVGSSRSLSFRNNTASILANSYVRVRPGSTGCFPACSANSQYRIRFRETTLMIPRFNNSGSQVTILIMQNGSHRSVAATASFWSLGGVRLGFSSFTMPPRGGHVVNTAIITGVNGVSGVITVEHDGAFGRVTGKTVALEPATGFSFDTPAVPQIF